MRLLLRPNYVLIMKTLLICSASFMHVSKNINNNYYYYEARPRVRIISMGLHVICYFAGPW